MKKAASKLPSITIIGAGIAGSFLAVLLAKRGYFVDVYERGSEADILDLSSKRSFNLTFFGYGVKALQEAGLWDEVRPIMLPLKGGATQILPHGKYVYSRFEEGEMQYYAVARAKLLEVIVSAAKREPLVTFHFSTPLVSINRHARTITVTDPKSHKNKIVKATVVIGADGVNSMVRAAVQQGQETKHSQEYAPWTYRQVALTMEDHKKLGLRPNMAYSWTRKRASFIGFPQIDGQFGALLMLPKNDAEGFASINTAEDVKKLVTTQFPALFPVLDVISENILNNPEGDFVTINTKPWTYQDFMAIVGDAAHGFPPFFGMGTATAFGDCLEIANLLDVYGNDWGSIFPLYEKNRKPNTDVISTLSNEMLKRFTRHTRADRSAIYDRLETILSNRMPHWYLPSVYYLVAHNPNRSAEYFRKHEAQRKRDKYIGVSFGVTALTAAVAFTEKLTRK